MDRRSPPSADETRRLGEAVHAAQRGDDDAFRMVYRGVQPGLLRYLRYLVGDDADDIASETWLQVVRDLRSFRGDGDRFRGWVATIGRNRAIDHLRAQRRRPVQPVATEDLAGIAAPADPAGEAVDAVSTAAALALIATLPPDQAEAVLLRVVVGLDAKGAARVLGKRSGAVRTAAHRGLRELSRRVSPRQGPEHGVTPLLGSTLREMR